MRWQGLLSFGLGASLTLMSTGNLRAQTPTLPSTSPIPQGAIVTPTGATSTPALAVQKTDPAPMKPATMGAPGVESCGPTCGSSGCGFNFFDRSSCCGGLFGGIDCTDDCKSPLGPTPFPAVGILQDWIYGKDNKDACLKIGGWADFNYTYNSTGHGPSANPSGGPGIAPVMNRFGNEFNVQQLGLLISKPLDKECWSWGFNIIALAGADASFLTPTKGGWANTNPRFGFDFTDLNLTAHLPILTEGGVDVKAGRQTTILGPMGALAWQRPFTSSDYAWYNMEEGRYTGVSAVWHVNKQLDWYNGFELGWGTFFAQKGIAPQYITNISYWLDEDAKKAKVWTTLLTGPTTDDSNKNTTVVEFGFQYNWNRYLWTIIDTQMVYSRGPVFGAPTPGYIERAYDVYTYNGIHLNKCWDFNTRAEYYYDADGNGYAGGFGIPKTSYVGLTAGLNFHPTKWMEFRPEIRYDYATNPAFGPALNNLHRNELTVAADLLIKF